jgi:hypothetical protein
MSRKRNQKQVNIPNHELVILFLIALSVILVILHMAIVVYIGVGVFVAENIWMIIRKVQGNPFTKEEARRLDLYVIGFFILLACVWVTGIQLLFGIVAGVVLAVFFVWQIMKRKRRMAITSDINTILHWGYYTTRPHKQNK